MPGASPSPHMGRMGTWGHPQHPPSHMSGCSSAAPTARPSCSRPSGLAQTPLTGRPYSSEGKSSGEVLLHAFWGPPLLNASDLPQAKCYLRKEPANAGDSAGNKKKVRDVFRHLSSFHRVGKDRREIKQTSPRRIYSCILRPLTQTAEDARRGRKNDRP